MKSMNSLITIFQWLHPSTKKPISMNSTAQVSVVSASLLRRSNRNPPRSVQREKNRENPTESSAGASNV